MRVRINGLALMQGARARPSRLRRHRPRAINCPLSTINCPRYAARRIGQAAAGGASRWRKVRAPQGRVPGNAWGPRWRRRGYGKCRRKQTARRLSSRRVRVKRCGKSAPRRWQQRWQGKPHPEQDQIGTHGRGPRRVRVGRLRPAATRVPDEWLSTTEPGLSTDPPYSAPKGAALTPGKPPGGAARYTFTLDVALQRQSGGVALSGLAGTPGMWPGFARGPAIPASPESQYSPLIFQKINLINV